MVVAFLGTHIPLLSLLFSFVTSTAYSWETAMGVLGVALIATLGGTAATLYALHHLLAPVRLTSIALRNYLRFQKLPELPTQFADEAGTLMADTSQTLHQLNELIHYISNYDNLTGLPNRKLLCDRICQTLLRPEHNQRMVAVLVVSINDYTGISQALGQEALGLLLRTVAQRLTNNIGSSDLLAYLGKDEFAIARIDIPSLESLVKLSQLLLSTLAKPFLLAGRSLHITASIGLSLMSIEDSQQIDQLLQQAQMALTQAKQQGVSQYQFYSPELNAQLQERLALENDLYGALERNEMIVYYQPLVDLRTGQVTAVEALVRWQHPIRGMVSPAQFIPIAEANGLIVAIGEWVLQQACIQCRLWQRAGLPPLRMSVNLSARQFEQPNLVNIVSQILQKSGLDPAYLELEVTESFLMDDIERSVSTLKRLRDLGVVLALDDFGTGYSSLNYLKCFPVDMLKIDRSFVQDTLSHPDSAAITDAIIALAKSLRLSITAEGIETQAQLDYLQTRGCHEGQGFYFSRPVPPEALVELLLRPSQPLEAYARRLQCTVPV
nr:GGDEF domain-containing phosphodiesterase [Pseudanabaena sp. FACHB-2040]